MKTRTGFVSNSSSSSFIIRGMMLSAQEIIDTLNLQDEIEREKESGYMLTDYNLYYFLAKKFEGNGFSVENSGNYFGSKDWKHLVIGQSRGYLEDGEVMEFEDLSPEEDAEILNKFKSLGFDGTLKTYIQMISNDNY